MRTTLPLHSRNVATQRLQDPVAGAEFTANPASTSGQLCSHQSMPQFFQVRLLGIDTKSNTHLCSAVSGLLRNASFSTYLTPEKGLTDADQQSACCYCYSSHKGPLELRTNCSTGKGSGIPSRASHCCRR